MNTSEPSSPDNLSLQQLLRSLHDLDITDGDSELQFVELKMGDILFEQGATGDSLYLLIAGSLGVRVRHADGSQSEIDRLHPGDVVGEMAVLSGQQRSATVYAVNDCGLFQLSQATYEAWLAKKAETAVSPQANPPFSQQVSQQFDTRWKRIQLSHIFTNLLGELDATTLHMLQAEVNWLHLTNGDIIFRQGDEPDGMYVVVNGRLRVSASSPEEGEQVLVEITPGETVGEFALISPERRSATVYAVRETNVVHITTESFNKLVQHNPQFMAQITKIIVNRHQREMMSGPATASQKLSVALLPASPDVDIKEFARQLSAAAAVYGDSATLDDAQFDELYGQPGAAQSASDGPMNSAITGWLDEYEDKFSYLFFVADATPTPWTKRCIGNADRVLVVAHPDGDPAPSAVEQLVMAAAIPLRMELVLWHSPQTERPLHTSRWLDARQVHAHHHIRQNDDAYMARLARRLTGNAVGLVLSGGAARGFAHAGVHRAMEELQIPIDYIAGTSMGAVVASAILVAKSNAELVKFSAQFANPKALFDRTLPFTAFMTSRKVTRFTQELYGDLQIEDSWIPFFCVASNITMAEPVIYQRGPMWRAVRASLAIPGVFTPVMDNGETIVDGGVMDNFPAQKLAHLCESDRIIGVNVAPFKEKKRTYDFETSISGWRILFSRINPFVKPKRAPSLIGVLLRTLEINSVRQAREDEAFVDIMIYPETRGVGMLDFHKYQTVIQAGYEAALEPLRVWRDTRLKK